jgi:Xaa-Pro dipeptidase|tara:strand:+ start:3201 stop:4340 length:1140 start_codon:yes stop_codon:yes gene_type:complete
MHAYPMLLVDSRFSNSEYQARHRQTIALAKEHDCSAVLTFGENKSGVVSTWLTGWGTTRLALNLLTEKESLLWILFQNHTPAAKRTAQETQVFVYDIDAVEKALTSFKGKSLATIGTATGDVRKIASKLDITLITLDKAHAKMRAIKSVEEVEILRAGAKVTDLGAQELIESCKIGASDWQIFANARSGYTVAGGRDHICYICVADMNAPDRDVPSQFPEGRIVRENSAITFEISASASAEYPGQVLRTVTIGEPTAQYKELHAVADETLARMRKILKPGISALDLIAASSIIEEAGFTTTDDLFHGLGAGYLEPIGTSRSRIPMHAPDLTIEAGMAIVLQPNVTTIDHSAGVQTGEMVIVTSDGFEDIHHITSGLLQR